MLESWLEIIKEWWEEKIKPLLLRYSNFLFLLSLTLLLFLASQMAALPLWDKSTSIRLSDQVESFPTRRELEAKGSNNVGLSAQQAAPAAISMVKVSITGSINKPGIYSLDRGSVIADLITVAGGVTKTADTSYLAKNLNLAKVLEGQEQIYIPDQSEHYILTQLSDLNKTINASPLASPTATSKINLNTASLAQLDTLSGVGQSTAEKIIAARPYQKIDDIKNVPGIGDATFEKIKDLIEV